MLLTLKHKTDFDRVYKRGKFLNNPLFNVRFLKNHLDINRYGIVVSKKVSKKAVVRNKLRRQIKCFLSSIKLNTGYDIIITAKPSCLEQTYQQLTQSLLKLFKRGGFREKSSA